MKTYAPDLIVHPILREDAYVSPRGHAYLCSHISYRKESDIRTQLEGIMDRLHVLVVGPGLGREDYMQKYAKLAVTIAREKAMYVVVDADGLWMVGHNLELVKGYRRAVLTPNVVEFKRLSEAVVSVT
jgi:ATP-dependent NAD(P)H-hydrate dehydratase